MSASRGCGWPVRTSGPSPGTALVGGSVLTGPLPTAVGAYRGEQLSNAAAVINAGAKLGVNGQSGSFWARAHTGTDFSLPCGTPVFASHAGTVSVEASVWAGPRLVKISTGPESLTTWYAHLQTIAVTAGDVVAAGTRIGEVGALGNATGCHLHFEVHTANGPTYGADTVNPSVWLTENVGTFLGGAGTLKVVQANIKTGSPGFGASMGGVLEKTPDLV